MMILDTQKLIHSLKKDIASTMTQAQDLQNFNSGALSTPPQAGSWSITQVLAHLNTYNAYYLPVINRAYQSNKTLVGSQVSFKTGWLGNYFVKLMQPGKNGKVNNKMKAAKQHTPAGNPDAAIVLADFIDGQRQLLQLLDKAGNYNLQQIRVTISISSFIKIRLGDAFRFLAAHQLRHFVQIEEAKKLLPKPVVIHTYR